jgi:hypothetical protein
MADPRDDRVSAAYRELPGEGPPPALDAAIQAAARRAVGARPGGARRWQVPVSIAAVLALAIGVSLQVERENPVVVDGTPVPSGSAEYPVPQAAPEDLEPAPREEARPLQKRAAPMPEAKRVAPEAPRVEAPPPSRAEPRPSPPAAESLAVPMPASPPTAAAPATFAPAPSNVAAPPATAGAAATADAVRAAPQPAMRAKKEFAREAATQEKAKAGALETPERRLERIADLRAKGLHDEADRALAEFRRAYPDYRIGEELLRRVQRH